ncbi:MAG: hypothetical protein NVS3B3_07850 [Aquirhabdus sp.]
MASQKNAVSVNDTKSNHMTHSASTPTSTAFASNTVAMFQQNAKHFKKNVFLSAFLLGNIFFAEQAFALSVQPLQVKSVLGEPFRAQIVITDIAGVDPATIKASLASSSEFIQLGINKRQLANDLNFNTVITSPERGLITITSDRPLNDPYIEFVVHIGFGNNVRLQQVTALVDPPLTRIQPETLNLPVQQIQLAETSSTPVPAAPQPTDPNIVKVTSSVTSRTIPLIPSRSTPPAMSEPTNGVAETPLAREPQTTEQATPLIPSSNTPLPMTTSPVDGTPTAPDSAPQPEKPTPEPTAPEKNAYTVKRNDSLWAIATRVQKGTNQPVTVIMRSIQQMNKSAFIHGNPNHIKNGATIILPNQQDIQEAPKTDSQSAVVENDDVESNKAPILKTPNQQAKTAKTPYVRRGHLPDAKMTLVAPTIEGTAQGSANDKQSEEKARKLTQLNLKITSARQRNMTLSQEVSELEAKIKANDQKLALRNARLAELMQRLKNRKDVAQQNANRTPKS